MKKITGVIIGCMIVFAAGFYSFGKTGFLTDKRRDSFMMECNNASNNWVIESDVAAEDAAFLFDPSDLAVETFMGVISVVLDFGLKREQELIVVAAIEMIRISVSFIFDNFNI